MENDDINLLTMNRAYTKLVCTTPNGKIITISVDEKDKKDYEEGKSEEVVK